MAWALRAQQLPTLVAAGRRCGGWAPGTLPPLLQAAFVTRIPLAPRAPPGQADSVQKSIDAFIARHNTSKKSPLRVPQLSLPMSLA